MQKTYLIFKKYLPIILAVSALALIFGLLTMVYYYSDNTMSIDFKNVIPIFTAALVLIAFVLSIVFTFKVNNTGISKIKKSFGVCKFASLLAATLAAASFFFDFFRFVDQPGQFSVFRIIRLIVFIPFIAYLIINVIPKKIKRKRVTLPVWLKPVTAFSSLIWCILGLVMIYFWQAPSYSTVLGTTNIFKVAFIIYYLFVTIFFIFEIKYEFISSAPKGYVLFSSFLFVYSITIIGPIMLKTVLSESSNLGSISLFEIFLAFALGLYALAKMIAMQQTMRFVIKKRGGSTHAHRHHHHHHHHKHSKSEGADATNTDDTLAEIVINESDNK